MNKILINNTPAIRFKEQSSGITRNVSPNSSFQQILDTVANNQEIKFTKHALQRLESRNITLTQNDMSRIQEGLHKAREKGIRETLVLMDNKAFVASVQNKTIITAALDEQLKENVFTNIDGAVIV
ncbi:MAG: TIGR02530 family flagellar biosynthesis protein [Bacillota bacterium]